jgi:hypothetical protein
MNSKVETARRAFYDKAKIKHSNLYDYSKFIYVNAIQKSIIICPIHGEFLQNAHNHLLGKGCPKCGHLKIEDACTMNLDKFIKKANKRFNNAYDYSNVIFDD